MKRRAYLGASVTTLALAGCLGVFEDDETVLDAPSDQPRNPEAVAYPAHGQELPSATLPSPLHDRTVDTREYVGEREAVATFVYARCPDVCSALTANLAQAQVRAAEGGFADEIALLPITFDPAHDTEPVIREYTAARGADPAAENWQFLRPETPERATDVVTGTFGVPFRRNEGSDGHSHDDGGHNHDGDGHSHGGDSDHSHGGDGHSHDDESSGDGTSAENASDGGHGHVTFGHRSLTLLANRDGYVERAYTGSAPPPNVLLDDLAAVRESYR